MLSARDGSNSQGQYYNYQPSMAAAIIFIILFGVATSLHFVQMIRSRVWFMIPFVIGGIFEAIGYVGRAVSANDNPGPWNIGPYILQAVLLLVAPALFAASIYMELGRIVHMLDGDHALFIRRTWLTKIFVGDDILSFTIQSSGAGLLASSTTQTINTGKAIVVCGLFVQLLFFGLFVLAAALFHLRINKQPTQKCSDLPWWRNHMLSLYIVSILIFVRSMLRVVEYLEGYHGYIMNHEAFIYVFDGLLMVLAMATMNWMHPGQVARELRGVAGSECARSGRDGEQGHTDGMKMGYVAV